MTSLAESQPTKHKMQSNQINNIDILDLSVQLVQYFTYLIQRFGTLNCIKILCLDLEEWYIRIDSPNYSINTNFVGYNVCNGLLHGRFRLIHPQFHMDGYFNQSIFTGLISCFGTYEGWFENNVLKWSQETYFGFINKKIQLHDDIYNVTEYFWGSDDIQVTYKIDRNSRQVGKYIEHHKETL